MSKKASTELGVNFIVILIIALVILGLSIAFLTNMFTSSGSKFERYYEPDVAELVFHASQANPLLFQSNEIKIRPGESQTTLVSVYNNGFSSGKEISVGLMGCIDAQGSDSASFKLSSLGQKIESGKDAGFKVIMTSLPNTAIGSYICNVAAGYKSVDNAIDTQGHYVQNQITVNVEI